MINHIVIIFVVCIMPAIAMAEIPMTPYDDTYNSLDRFVPEIPITPYDDAYSATNIFYKKYIKAKSREQSTANKILGAAAIGIGGIGGMKLMSGMAEQSADTTAEADMRAYLATFVCDYGQGRNIKGGDKNIEMPGGNDLISTANEYRALAADLKVRKTALGTQPGIESEVIYDIAETGLYDNMGVGRQSGAYTSLSRTLSDDNDAPQ